MGIITRDMIYRFTLQANDQDADMDNCTYPIKCTRPQDEDDWSSAITGNNYFNCRPDYGEQ